MEKILKFSRDNKAIIVLIFLTLGFGIWNLNNKQPAKPVPIKTESIQKKPDLPKKSAEKILMIDIQGAVKSPGVYRLKEGAITQEVIKLAGGITEDADIKQVNQAQKVTDQMQIIVPRIGDTSENKTENKGPESKNPVNINSAKVEDFQAVTGIGPKKAQKIIEFREQNGNFKNLKDLTKVSGIGDKTLESLKDQLTV